MINVFLKVNKKKGRYQLPTDDTILDLKEMIFEDFEIPIHLQKILHRTGELSNNTVLSSVKRRKRKLQLACIGYFNPKIMQVRVGDVIEYVIGFLPMNDVISCSQVCLEWRRLANLGSTFNETRYVFIGNRCYDLLFQNVKYELPHVVHNINDVYLNEFEIKGNRPYRGSQYVICVDEEKLRVYRTYDGNEILTEEISKFIPKEFAEKMERRKTKIYVPDSEDKMSDYDSFGQLLGSHYDKKRNEIFLIFDSFIVISDLHGKVLGTIDIDKEAFGRYTVFGESISFSDDYLLLRKNHIFTNEDPKFMIICKDKLKVVMEVNDYDNQIQRISDYQRTKFFFDDFLGLVALYHNTNFVKFRGSKLE